jgi:hypothetical protein
MHTLAFHLFLILPIDKNDVEIFIGFSREQKENEFVYLPI